MTNRQARKIVFWLVLVPLAIGVWAQFLPPCIFGCAPKSQEQVPPPQSAKANWGMVICPFAPPCWKDGRPIEGSL